MTLVGVVQRPDQGLWGDAGLQAADLPLVQQLYGKATGPERQGAFFHERPLLFVFDQQEVARVTTLQVAVQLRFQRLVKAQALDRQLRAEAKLAVLDLDQAKVRSRGSRGQFILFDQQGPQTVARELVCHGAAHQPAANHHRVPGLAHRFIPAQPRSKNGANRGLHHSAK